MAWTEVEKDAERVVAILNAEGSFWAHDDNVCVDERSGVAEFILTPRGADPEEGTRYAVTIRDVS
jgi:hypothetical protein